MKIGLVSPFSFSNYGGVQTHIRALQREFKKLGHQATILLPRQTAYENYGPEVLLLGYSFPLPANASRIDVSWGVPWETEKALKREKFDLLHFHGLSPFLGFQILDLAKELKIPVVFTSHTNFDKSFLAQIFPVVPEIYFDYIRNRAAALLAVSPAALKILNGFKVRGKIIPNGVDLREFKPKGGTIKKYQDGKINILFVGRLDERKGLRVLLNSFLRLSLKQKNLRLLLIGDGPLWGSLGRYRRAHPTLDVEVLGKVEPDWLADFYRTAHIFCAPSLGGESFGLVLLEAMASGLPVVASNIVGYREVLEGFGRNLMFEAGDDQTLTKVLGDLIENPKLRQKYSDWGLKKVQEYSWSKIASRVLADYERVIRKSKKET